MRRPALLLTAPALVLALAAGGALTAAPAGSASPGAARTVAVRAQHLDPPTCC